MSGLNKFMKYAVVGALLLAASPAAAQEAEEQSGPGAELNLSLYTDYMFRGQNLYDGTSVQPEARLFYDFGEAGRLSGGTWLHLSAEGDRQAEKFNEVDLDVTYEATVGMVELALGNRWYLQPDEPGGPDTAEFFAAATLDLPAHPSLAFIQDWRAFDLQWYELTFSEPFELCGLGEGVTAEPYVTFGFATSVGEYYERAGLEYINWGASMEIPLGMLTLSPNAHYTHKIDDQTVNEFWFGMTFSYGT